MQSKGHEEHLHRRARWHEGRVSSARPSSAQTQRDRAGLLVGERQEPEEPADDGDRVGAARLAA
ncbi:hypothetical protein [Micromonospora ureilytica]|uniref:hypothetical protein n=1 Tax=Micromonospora ureilytica TaxID=709868 RepID=UPI004038FF79